jgi:hypothetical protein
MIVNNIYKAKKGLIRVTKRVENGVIIDVKITGDFFMYPEEYLLDLERRLRGVRDDKDAVEKAVSEFFRETGAITPFITEKDFVAAITGVEAYES